MLVENKEKQPIIINFHDCLFYINPHLTLTKKPQMKINNNVQHETLGSQTNVFFLTCVIFQQKP